MSKSLIQSVQGMSDAFTDFYMRLAYGYEGIAEVWEKKMHPGVFELRMDMRRDEREERKNMALLRMIGGLLTVLYWFFVLVGVLAVVGLLFSSPLIAAIVLVCILAGVVSAWCQLKKKEEER